ncbi:S-adenosyl-L-methionine-dependent methyltransferase [Dissophora ornata]|nr:hypothetical protein BGZ58_001772 [Dissophora ornata]KAI8604591.1 S-adenosyl-L-methionine-dependent methyltransferase [Dissophora ornata]
MSPHPHTTSSEESVQLLTVKNLPVETTKQTPPTGPSPTCYGRVKNPESYVPSAWWKSGFDHLYLQTDGDVVEDPAITLQEIRLLEEEEIVRSIFQTATPAGAEDTRILDLCCGQGRHLLQLAELYPHLDLHGHDLSQYLVELAQSRATSANVSNRVQFTMGDSREIPHSDNSFALVMVMGNSFGYFASDNENKDLLKEIYRVLRPGGYVVLDIPDGAYLRENYLARGWEWVNDTMLACRERELSKDGKRLVCREVVMSTSKGVIRDQFYAERLYDLEEISLLVRECGLVPLEQRGGKNTTGKDMSKRGEDLGMMEHRQFIHATKPL